MDDKRCVVVSGASKGIGYVLCKLLVSEGFYVFGSSRKEEDAIALQHEFGGSFFPLILDVTDEASVQKAAVQVRWQCSIMHTEADQPDSNVQSTQFAESGV